ncbi:hypothetical protein [Archaeoglobus veneficus]|uniref:Uncharacterized protein n=1 Tax=Archaeoglobus veneficus (strain DSM 11195 / SNP6) TaxID=693661 RepID=F2KR99_ARCVS|nr:hypothetical protein [Archaeoglobus veneficus]AEA47833.1 hypothetical protein Arcve_1837 [Archaeoglobus veneficus SNP6]
MKRGLLLLLILVILFSGCTQQNEQPSAGPVTKKMIKELGGPYNGSLWVYSTVYKGKPYNATTIAFTVNGVDYSGYMWDPSFTPSLDWIKNNTSPDARFICWWDYAGMLMGYAGRYAVVYAPSKEILDTVVGWNAREEALIPHEIIKDVATALTSEDPEVSLKIAEKYGADCFYVTKNDVSYFPIILRAAGKNMSEYIELSDNEWDVKKPVRNVLLARMLKGEDIPGFKLEYNDGNVIIYRVLK